MALTSQDSKLLKKNRYDKIPTILGSALIIDLKNTIDRNLLWLMQYTFDLKLNNNPSMSTTRNNTCIDTVITRHIEHLQIQKHILYFSCRKPLFSITDVPIFSRFSTIY